MPIVQNYCLKKLEWYFPILTKYEKMRLDTLNSMEDALKIYYKNDFYKIEPYYNNPADGVIYLEKKI